MTKIVGMMCVRDEADLLPEVLEHFDGKLDALYVYEDGSQDGTAKILLESSQVTYFMSRTADRNRMPIYRPNYHHLLEKIKEDYDLEKEDVWVVITMGDRFFLNKTPRQIVEEAEGYTSVEGVQLDFLRHRMDPWTEENDHFPDYEESLRKICRWAKVDERCIVVYKATNEASYLKAKYPWPRSIGMPQYGAASMGEKLSLGMPYLEHQGRRSPKAAMWRYESGSRSVGKKYQHYDLTSFEATVKHMRRMYEPYKVFPWVSQDSLASIVEWWNEEQFHDKVNIRWFFKGVETALQCTTLPDRKDLK